MATSYTNPGGSGNRTGIISVSAVGVNSVTAGFHLVEGSLTDTGFYLTTSTGCSIEFWFNSRKIIDEAKFYQQNTSSHGTWKWQGSNDRTTWTDIGSTFTLGGVATQTITTLAGNATGYIFYRLLQTGGTTSSSPYLYEMEFKIEDSDTVSYSNSLGSGNRTTAITVTQSGVTWGAGSGANLVNGVLNTNEAWWNTDASVAGDWIRFDLGAAVVMQQARVWWNTTVSQGNWKWQGSTNASTWVDLGTTFAMANVDPSPVFIGGFETNVTAYRYYRLLGVSGGRTNSPDVREFEFMVGPAPPTSAYVSQVAVEIVLPPDPPVARVSQVAVEVIIAPVSLQARVSQVAVEVVYYPVVVWGDEVLGPFMGGAPGEVWSE